MAPLSEPEEREFRRIIKAIDRARKRAGWSQERVAKLLGIRQETYSRYLTGASRPESPLVLDGIKARLSRLRAEFQKAQNKVIEELRESQRELDEIMKGIEDLKGGD
jgi:transcriptional regulator with XRE-family HTH domain